MWGRKNVHFLLCFFFKDKLRTFLEETGVSKTKVHFQFSNYGEGKHSDLCLSMPSSVSIKSWRYSLCRSLSLVIGEIELDNDDGFYLILMK